MESNVLANIFIIVILTYYTKYILIVVFSRKNRKNIKEENVKLENLRRIPVKTIEQQKEFLDLRYPKRKKFKWTWLSIFNIIKTMFIYVVIFQGYRYLFGWLGLGFQIWHAVLFVVFFPMLLNLILSKFGIQKSDLTVFFRGGKAK